MNLSGHLVKSILTGAGAFIVRSGLNLLFIPVFFRLLGTETFGFYLFLLTFSEFLMMFDAGLTAGIIHRLSQHIAVEQIHKIKQTLCIAQWLYLSISFLLIFFGSLIAPVMANQFHVPHMVGNLGCLAFQIVFFDAGINLISYYFQSILQARLHYQQTNLTEMAHSILCNGLGVLAVMLGGSLLEVLLIRLGVTSLRCFYLFIAAKRVEAYVFQRPKDFSVRAFKDIFEISFFALIRNISVQIAHRIDELIIGFFMGMASVALYGLVLRIFNQLSQLALKMIEVVFPVFARLASTSDMTQARFLFLRTSSMMHYTIGVLILLIFGSFPEIIALLGSGKVTVLQTLPLAILMAIVIWSSSLQMPAGNYLFASGKHRFQTISTFITAFTNLGLSLLLVKPLGLIGVILGTLIPHLIQHHVFTIFMACRQMGIPPMQYIRTVYLCNALPLLSLAIPLVWVRLSVENPGILLIASSAAGVLGSLFLWYFLAASEYEKQFIRKTLSRILAGKLAKPSATSVQPAQKTLSNASGSTI